MIVYRKTAGLAHDLRFVDDDYVLVPGDIRLDGDKLPAIDTLHDPVAPSVTKKAALQAQIVALEVAQLAPRYSREGILGLIADAYSRSHAVTVAQAVVILSTPSHPDYNVGFARLKVFDDAIVALRTQMAAL